jgi:hypothetical protein
LKKIKSSIGIGCLVVGLSSVAFSANNTPFSFCIDAQNRFKIYDYHQTSTYLASALAQINGENFALSCGLSNDPADIIPIACAGNNGNTIVSVRIHQKPNDRPRAAVVGVRQTGESLDINSIVPLVCE